MNKGRNYKWSLDESKCSGQIVLDEVLTYPIKSESATSANTPLRLDTKMPDDKIRLVDVYPDGILVSVRRYE